MYMNKLDLTSNTVQNYLRFKLSANKWLLLNWTGWNETIWSFNCLYQQNEFTNQIFNKYVQIYLALNKQKMIAQSAGAVEYTDCTSAEG